MKSSGNVMQTIKDYSGQIKNKLSELSLKPGGEVELNKFGGSIVGIITKMQAFGVEIFKLNDSFGDFMKGQKGDGWADISNQFTFIKENVKSLEGAFGKGMPGLSQLGVAIGQVSDSMVLQHKYAQNANAMQREIMQMAAAQGQLNNVIGETGDKIDRLPDRMLKLSDQFSKGANANALTVKEYSGLARTLIDQVPGSLNATFTMLDSKAGKVTGGITQLDAAIKIAVGSGRAYSEVASDMAEAFNNLNANAEVASKYSAAIGATNQSLGLIMKDTNTYFDAFTKHLKDTGLDAASQERAILSASNILGRYSQSLRDTGLSAKSSTELITKLTDSIMKTSIAEKSFLSARSGGVGGLQGGFRIEKMIKEGRTDEVVDMAEKNLRRQFGGKVYTLDDASKSSEAASQFYKQREMLKSGTFGIGKGMEDDQASRFLESLASGKKGKGLTDLDSTLNNTVNVGNKIQEKQLSELTLISNSMSNVEAILGVRAQGKVQRVFGAEDGLGVIKDQTAKATGLARGMYGDRKTDTKMNVFAKSADIEGQLENTQNDVAAGLIKSSKNMPKIVGRMTDEVRKDFIDPMLSMGKLSETEAKVNAQKQRAKDNLQITRTSQKPTAMDDVRSVVSDRSNVDAGDTKVDLTIKLLDKDGNDMPVEIVSKKAERVSTLRDGFKVNGTGGDR